MRGILYNSLQAGDTSLGWDNGDNIVYPKVVFNKRNTITIQARCDKRVYVFFWTTVGYRTVTASILSSRNGKTFWVG